MITPDRAPLAGWWQRVVAYVIDYLLISIVSTAATLREQLMFGRDVGGALRAWMTLAQFQLQQGGELPGVARMVLPLEARYVILEAHHIPIAMAVSTIYFAVMLRWKSATLGQLALRLRVQMEEPHSGPLPLSAIAIRVAVQFGIPGLLALYGLLNLTGGSVHVALLIVVLYILNDLVRALWDRRNRTWHDRIAETIVVRLS